MEPCLKGCTAIITGGGGGIGREMGLLFADEGAVVVVMDLLPGTAGETAKLIERAGGAARAVVGDVRSTEDVDRAIEAALVLSDRLDVMVNNAGVPRDAELLEMSTATWREVIDVHLTGAWIGTQRAARVMRRYGGGSIVNMSSVAGKVGSVGQVNYSAAKAGMVGLTKAAAKELGPHGIRVNAIQPGSIRTDRTARFAADRWAAKIAEVPLGREGTPRDVASVALFLASEMSSYVTGAVIEVAGGRYM